MKNKQFKKETKLGQDTLLELCDDILDGDKELELKNIKLNGMNIDKIKIFINYNEKINEMDMNNYSYPLYVHCMSIDYVSKKELPFYILKSEIPHLYVHSKRKMLVYDNILELISEDKLSDALKGAELLFVNKK